MNLCNCDNSFSCKGVAIVLSVIVGVLTTILRITGILTVPTVFFWVAFGVALGFLGLALLTSAGARSNCVCVGKCNILSTLVVAAILTALLALIPIGVTFSATGVTGSIVIGLLLLFFTLTISSAACYVKCLVNCGD